MSKLRDRVIQEVEAMPVWEVFQNCCTMHNTQTKEWKVGLRGTFRFTVGYNRAGVEELFHRVESQVTLHYLPREEEKYRVCYTGQQRHNLAAMLGPLSYLEFEHHRATGVRFIQTI